MYGFVFCDLVCFFFCVVDFPFSFPVVPGGGAAMIAAWTPLSPKYGKEVADRVAMFPVAFGTHMSASATSPVVVYRAFC